MGLSTIDDPSVLIKAGGVVWDSEHSQRKVLVIHRPKYNDWTLPKGKREFDDRSWLDTAQREVLEETYSQTKVLGFGGVVYYTANNLPNVVLYWEMLHTGNANKNPKVPDETDEIVWLTPSEALQRLTHVAERKLVAKLTEDDLKPLAKTYSNT